MSKSTKSKGLNSKATDAQDVLQFLDSLPEVKQNKQPLKPKKTVSGSAAGKAADSGKVVGKKSTEKQSEEIFEFLNELEKSKLSIDESKKDSKRSVTKKAESESGPEPELKKVEEKEKKVEEQKEKVDDSATTTQTLNDPITTFSNWWSTSGSSKVSNFWEKATEQASQLKQKVIQQESATTQLPINFDAIKSLFPVNINIDNLNNNLKDLATNLNATATIHDLTKQLTKFVVGETEEVLRIHLVHDLVNLDYLQRHVQDQFERVLRNQVQGNIRVFVDEWGKPSAEGVNASGNNNNNKNKNNIQSQFGIFGDDKECQLNVFEGKVSDGEKLAFANLDDAIKLFTKSREEIVKQQQQQQQQEGAKDYDNSESESESESTSSQRRNNISDIFISILPVAVVKNSSSSRDDTPETIVTTDSTSAGNFSFTFVLRDVTNDITTITRSQGFPLRWVEWIEKNSETTEPGETGETGAVDEEKEREEEELDVGEWVQDWLEDGISLAVGVVAQNYVISRMGL